MGGFSYDRRSDFLKIVVIVCTSMIGVVGFDSIGVWSFKS